MNDLLHLRALKAELIGTFLLALAILVSLRVPGFPVSTPVAAAVTLMVLVYGLGPISGAHFNPSITIALGLLKKIDPVNAAAYIVVQIIGALLAVSVANFLAPLSSPLLPVEVGDRVGVAELFGTFVLAFGIAVVVFGKAHEALSGLLIAASLFVGIVLAASASNAALNPAVALAIGSMASPYIA